MENVSKVNHARVTLEICEYIKRYSDSEIKEDYKGLEQPPITVSGIGMLQKILKNAFIKHSAQCMFRYKQVRGVGGHNGRLE